MMIAMTKPTLIIYKRCEDTRYPTVGVNRKGECEEAEER
jgi:hypothetical protein